jgi:hypothetical protein
MAELKLFYNRNIKDNLDNDLTYGLEPLQDLLNWFNSLPLQDITDVNDLKRLWSTDSTEINNFLIDFIPSGQTFAGITLTPQQILRTLNLDVSYLKEWQHSNHPLKEAFWNLFQITSIVGGVIDKDTVKYNAFIDTHAYLTLTELRQQEFYQDYQELSDLLKTFIDTYNIQSILINRETIGDMFVVSPANPHSNIPEIRGVNEKSFRKYLPEI